MNDKLNFIIFRSVEKTKGGQLAYLSKMEESSFFCSQSIGSDFCISITGGLNIFARRTKSNLLNSSKSSAPGKYHFRACVVFGVKYMY